MFSEMRSRQNLGIYNGTQKLLKESNVRGSIDSFNLEIQTKRRCLIYSRLFKGNPLRVQK